MRGIAITAVLFVVLLPISFVSFALLIYLLPLAIIVILGAKTFGGLTELWQVSRAPRSQWQGPDWWWEQAGISPTGQPLDQRPTHAPVHPPAP